MEELILLVLIVLLCLWSLYVYYRPRIDIVVLVKRLRVYLWYNKHDGPLYKRVYRFLFEI